MYPSRDPAINFNTEEYVLSLRGTLLELDVSSGVGFGEILSRLVCSNDSDDDNRASMRCPLLNGARPIISACPRSWHRRSSSNSSSSCSSVDLLNG